MGSITAPERMCAPTSEPFSTTTTVVSGESCLSRIAAASPAGPAPTITTSNSIASRAGSSSLIGFSKARPLAHEPGTTVATNREGSTPFTPPGPEALLRHCADPRESDDQHRPQGGRPRASRLLPGGGGRCTARGDAERPVRERAGKRRPHRARRGRPAKGRGEHRRPLGSRPRARTAGPDHCRGPGVTRRRRDGGARGCEKCRQPRGAARAARSLRRLRVADHRDPTRLRRRQSASARHVRGRSAGTRRGHRGPAVRRPLGQAARPHDGGDRARPHLGLYRQHRAVASARQSHAHAAGIRDLPAFHAAPDRARRPRHLDLPRQSFDADAAQQQGRHPQDARALVPLSHRHARDSRDGDAASRLSLAPAAAEAPCLAGFSRDQKGDGDVAPRSVIGNGRHSMAKAIEHVHWPNAPDMWMPYAPAIKVKGGTTVYLAGVTAAPVYHHHPHRPEEFDAMPRDMAGQARAALENLKRGLEAVGASFADVVTADRFVTDLSDQDALNRVWGEYFRDAKPATTTVQVVRLATDPRCLVEINAVAVTD